MKINIVPFIVALILGLLAGPEIAAYWLIFIVIVTVFF